MDLRLKIELAGELRPVTVTGCLRLWPFVPMSARISLPPLNKNMYAFQEAIETFAVLFVSGAH